MIHLINITLMALPLVAVAGAFTFNRRQRIEARNHNARQNGTQIAP